MIDPYTVSSNEIEDIRLLSLSDQFKRYYKRTPSRLGIIKVNVKTSKSIRITDPRVFKTYHCITELTPLTNEDIVEFNSAVSTLISELFKIEKIEDLVYILENSTSKLANEIGLFLRTEENL